jgi:hypothetical protein
MDMKLVAVVLASFLALPGLAAAEDDVLNPPGGPVYVEADHRPQAMGADQKQRSRELKRALMQQFDADGDGRLDQRERMRAARVLGKLSRKLAGRDEARQGRNGAGKRQRFIQRFDTNRDGNVDQSEMPPGAARKMRRLDRDRDGWVEPGELR